jgi:hypothetical protein
VYVSAQSVLVAGGSFEKLPLFCHFCARVLEIHFSFFSNEKRAVSNGRYNSCQMAAKWQLDGWKPSQFPAIQGGTENSISVSS